MPLVSFLLETSTTIVPGATAATGAATTAGTVAPTGIFSNPVTLVVGYCVLLVVVMYFFSVRPNRKREKAMQDMRSQIAVGDGIITNHGFFGTVVDITYESFIIEFGMNKGIRIPVLKGEVFGKREPNLSNEAPPQPPAPEKKKGLFSKKEEKEEKK